MPLVRVALACALACQWGCTYRYRALQPAEAPTPIVVELPRPTRDVVELRAALVSENADDRAAAAWELAGAQQVPSEVLEQLRDMSAAESEERVRLAAAWAYGHLESAARGNTPTRAYDMPPRQLRITRPEPPADRHSSRTGGDVLVDLLISERGEVAHAAVRQSVEGLNDLALKTVREWLFEPAQRQGKPVSSVALVSVSFRAYE